MEKTIIFALCVIIFAGSLISTIISLREIARKQRLVNKYGHGFTNLFEKAYEQMKVRQKKNKFEGYDEQFEQEVRGLWATFYQPSFNH